jgi:hypothetical protein
MLMNPLILKKIASHYGSPWTAKDDDYVVLDAGQVPHHAESARPAWASVALDDHSARSNRNGRSRLCDDARRGDGGF